MELIIIALLVVPAVLYFVISAAVQEGVYKALIEYDKSKGEKQEES